MEPQKGVRDAMRLSEDTHLRLRTRQNAEFGFKTFCHRMSMARRGLNGPQPELQRLLLNLKRIRSKEENMCNLEKMQDQEEYKLKQKKVKAQPHKFLAREMHQCHRRQCHRQE